MKKLKDSEFGKRMRIAFNGANNTEIAEILEVSSSAVTNYTTTRIPAAELLVQIADYTKCSIHWLLTGEGPERVSAWSGSDRVPALQKASRSVVAAPDTASAEEALKEEMPDEMRRVVELLEAEQDKDAVQIVVRLAAERLMDAGALKDDGLMLAMPREMSLMPNEQRAYLMWKQLLSAAVREELKDQTEAP